MKVRVILEFPDALTAPAPVSKKAREKAIRAIIQGALVDFRIIVRHVELLRPNRRKNE